jgi:hypothetical protein
MKRLYWKLWWWRRERRDDKFVKDVMFHLAGSNLVYIHPKNGGPPEAVILQVDAFHQIADQVVMEDIWDDLSHVEAR